MSGEKGRDTSLFYRTLLVLAFLFAGCTNGIDRAPTTTAAGFSTPLESVRPAAEQAIGVPLRLEIHDLRSDRQWAFVTATPRTMAGQPIDYANTPFADAVAAGEFDDWLCALVRKAPNGKWRLVTLVIGATDAPFVDWPERYGVPKALVLPDS